MSQRLSQTEKSLPIMLLRARETVMKRFRPLLKEHGISEQQWRVLRVLNELGPQEPNQLAEKCVILMPSLTRILANLDEQGLITRKKHAADGRRKLASVSDSGLELISRITPQSARIYADLEQQFGTTQIHQLMESLRRLSNL